MQLQLLFDERAAHAVSPFDKALAALRDGDAGRARGSLVNGLRRPGAAPVVPQTLDDAGARQLLGRAAPARCPYGDPWNEYVLTNLLVARRRASTRRPATAPSPTPASRSRCSPPRSPGPPAPSATTTPPAAWLRAAADAGDVAPTGWRR